jgi:hypothetical protein
LVLDRIRIELSFEGQILTLREGRWGLTSTASLVCPTVGHREGAPWGRHPRRRPTASDPPMYAAA